MKRKVRISMTIDEAIKHLEEVLSDKLCVAFTAGRGKLNQYLVWLKENAELKRLLRLASSEVHRPYPEYKYRFELEAEKIIGKGGDSS